MAAHAARPRKLVPASVEERVRKLLEGRTEIEAAPEVRPVKRGVLRVEQQAVKEKITTALKRLHPMD